MYFHKNDKLTSKITTSLKVCTFNPEQIPFQGWLKIDKRSMIQAPSHLRHECTMLMLANGVDIDGAIDASIRE